MKELFLLKLGEIVLKGQNRRVFEDKLKTVTRRRMAKFGEFKVNIVQSTLYVEPLTEDCDLDGAWEACGTIFGVARCAAAVPAKKISTPCLTPSASIWAMSCPQPKASRSNPSARISASR